MTGSSLEPEDSGRRLPPERWEIVKAQASERAYALRAQMLRDVGRWIARRSGAILKRFLLWQRRRRAVRELQRLDNRTLRDMGIARSEIEYLVAGGDPDRRAPRKAASGASSNPPDAASGRRAKIDRRAA